MLQDFVANEHARKRYWARSLVGWRRMRAARPNDAHHALASLERRAASRSSSRRTSTACTRRPAAATSSTCTGASTSCAAWAASDARRASELQLELERRNPAFAALDAVEAPDGDADLEDVDFAAFDVPACDACGGLLKPDVVFFGESVPGERVQRAMARARVRPTRCSSSARR